MSMDQPTLTTEELLTQAEAKTGFRPSVHQLGDWVSAGLLPPSRPGAGRGRLVGGTAPRQWDAECLPRLILIVGSRKGKQVTLVRAALALALGGYDPGPKYLREVLTTGLFDVRQAIQQGLGKNRAFLKARSLSAKEKRKRYHASVERRYTKVDATLRQFAERLEVVLLGLTPPQEGDALGQLLFVMMDQAGVLLQEASDQELRAAYRLTNEALPQGVPFLRLLQPSFHLMASGLAAHVPRDADREEMEQEAQKMIGDLFVLSTEKLASFLRLPVMMMLLYLQRQGEAAMTTFDAAVQQMLTLFEENIVHTLQTAMKEAEATALIGPADGTIVDAEAPANQGGPLGK
jgi:hypothetical protein